MISIKVEGVEKARSSIQALPAEVQRLVILRLSQIAFDSAQKYAGRHTKTGALFRSTYNRAIPGGREVGHDPKLAPHAAFVHWGTKPHKIRPKNRKALRWPNGGGFRFAKSVNHPGYKGDAWMIRAADDAVRQFTSVVQGAFKDAQ